jgi:hypothetical protein
MKLLVGLEDPGIISADGTRNSGVNTSVQQCILSLTIEGTIGERPYLCCECNHIKLDGFFCLGNLDP